MSITLPNFLDVLVELAEQELRAPNIEDRLEPLDSPVLEWQKRLTLLTLTDIRKNITTNNICPAAKSLFGNFFRQIMFGRDLYLGGAK